MAMGRSVCKAGAWLLTAYLILSLQGADAQANTTWTGPVVPGWGIALLVLMSIFLAGILFCVCCAPFCCRNNGIDGQQGISSAINRFKCWE